MLCYIESDKYGNDLSVLEDVVEEYTFFPLNEICGGFFFGAFNIMLAIEDMPGIQSLYLKTHVRVCVCAVKWKQIHIVFVFECVVGDREAATPKRPLPYCRVYSSQIASLLQPIPIYCVGAPGGGAYAGSGSWNGTLSAPISVRVVYYPTRRYRTARGLGLGYTIA